jgi:hypothetical protein
MRNVLRFIFGNWFARAYLMLVAVVISLVVHAVRRGRLCRA